MRVACICNMNNNFFSLVRYLRDRGIDTYLLLLDNEIPHYHPSHDTFDLSYKEFTVQLEWGAPKHFKKISSEVIRKDLDSYDFIIACGTALAFIEKGGRQIDLIVPHGSDIYSYPYVNLRINTAGGIRSIINSAFHISQKKAIKNASYINMQTKNLLWKDALKKLNILKKTYFFDIPMVYNKIYSPDNITQFYDKSAWYHEFKKIRDSFEIVVFNHSRQIWKTFVDKYSNKGSDKLIKGFAMFVNEHRTTKSCLVLFEYGVDVFASKRLILDLGIENNVIWFPLVSKKEIIIGLSLANIGTGHLCLGGFGGGTVRETLAMGKLLLHHRKKDEIGPMDFPFINVNTPDDIYEMLKDYIVNPAYYKEIGGKALEWSSNAIEKSLDTYELLIKGKEQNKDISKIVQELKVPA